MLLVKRIVIVSLDLIYLVVSTSCTLNILARSSLSTATAISCSLS